MDDFTAPSTGNPGRLEVWQAEAGALHEDQPDAHLVEQFIAVRLEVASGRPAEKQDRAASLRSILGKAQLTAIRQPNSLIAAIRQGMLTQSCASPRPSASHSGASGITPSSATMRRAARPRIAVKVG
jgi:hypothetical protein